MSARDDSLIGQVIAGEYVIESFLGSGAMGEVYAARSPRGTVAIKLLRKEHADDPDVVARFQRESKLARELRSEHVAAVLGSGVEPNGRVWIAFERLVGETLDARLHRGVVPVDDLRWIIDGVLQGLADAHAHRIIHRDIKPANIFLESSGRARILDFGVSKLLNAETGATTTGITTAGEALGTANYMAPEQMQNAATVTLRADLYALGVVLFRILTGRLPFEAGSYVHLRACKVHDDPPSLAAVTGQEWPEVVEAFAHTMTAREAGSRFASADAARNAWRFAWHALSNSRQPAGLSTGSMPQDAPTIDGGDTERGAGADTAEGARSRES